MADMKEGFWYKMSLTVVPFVFVWMTRIWFATCRVKTHGQEYRRQVDKIGGPVVASFWHYTILFIFYYMRGDETLLDEFSIEISEKLTIISLTQ